MIRCAGVQCCNRAASHCFALFETRVFSKFSTGRAAIDCLTSPGGPGDLIRQMAIARVFAALGTSGSPESPSARLRCGWPTFRVQRLSRAARRRVRGRRPWLRPVLEELCSRPHGKKRYRSGACGVPENGCPRSSARTAGMAHSGAGARLDVGVEGSSPLSAPTGRRVVGSFGARAAIDLDHGKVLLGRLRQPSPRGRRMATQERTVERLADPAMALCGCECRPYHSANQEQHVTRAGGRHSRRGCFSGTGPKGHGAELVGLVDCRAGRPSGIGGDDENRFGL